ncbi:DUF6861 domain-containing protein [Pseudomonas sp. TWI628]|uniref:DUF6861 domain-containing protein n=1 Tax=Pseudomonas sp. TWI628 TaxID=3136788 RepID=UPI0032082225
MDLLTNIPSWGDIERNLEQKFSELNQSVDSGLNSAHEAWDGFSRRVSNGANQAYGYLGGQRIDNVRQAMTLSYPIIQDNLKRKWSSIGIEQILPVLLQLVKEVSMILGGSVAVGSLAGGVAGAFAFGVGAAPGAVAGAGIGLQVGNLILMGLGLSAIAEYFYQGLPACLSTLQQGMATAWFAEDGLKPAGLDPTGGSSAQAQERVERAARQLARGQEQLVLLLLTAIVTYLTRGQLKAGIVSSAESIATRSARLQAEISNKQLAAWLAKNEQKLLANPELRVKEATPLKPAEPQTLREFYSKQDPNFTSMEDQIKKVSTFKTKGLSNAQIEDFLNTTDGEKLLSKLQAAAPDADATTIYSRAFDQVASGSTIPEVRMIDSPLVKIVPEGQSVSPYSPFFTTHEELQAAARSGKTLADSFGLPLGSESTRYSIFEMSPLQPTEVFVSKVAPTTELGGAISRSGEAMQYLTPNRGEWGTPKLMGTISN